METPVHWGQSDVCIYRTFSLPLPDMFQTQSREDVIFIMYYTVVAPSA